VTSRQNTADVLSLPLQGIPTFGLTFLFIFDVLDWSRPQFLPITGEIEVPLVIKHDLSLLKIAVQCAQPMPMISIYHSLCVVFNMQF
jgi:hypothetical protein